MPSEANPANVYVWVWLPGATEPVVAGVLQASGTATSFRYAESFLAREDAVALYVPELPLRPGPIRPVAGLNIAGCIADAGPDAWGQRVILRRLFGMADSVVGGVEPHTLTFLLESGSDRIGALDFQASPNTYVPRSLSATLEELMHAAQRLEGGEPFSPDLDAALLRGSSIGGARPKALLDDDGRRLIAKFSSSTDPYPVVKAEAVSMELARRVGINVARTEVVECLGRDVLLVERFDRTQVFGERRMMVSALTMLELDEMMARYATYPALADVIRERFTQPKATLRELFSRIVFNILVGNTDDHARNHAAFWDGSSLSLTPAYDICPQTRSGAEAVQAMAVARDGSRFSQVIGCQNASSTYLLSSNEAREIIDHQLHTIRTQWSDAADAARLTHSERSRLWGHQILNPYSTQGYPA
ncbi:MAG: type II toxin-antitoxin system HipA family toxin [Acidimicrobiales bacterium]